MSKKIICDLVGHKRRQTISSMEIMAGMVLKDAPKKQRR